MARSEVAEVRQQIELECEALRRIYSDFAIVASHKIIQHKYRQLGAYQERLGTLIGEEESIEVMYETYTRVVG